MLKDYTAFKPTDPVYALMIMTAVAACRLADLMEQHEEELATIESIDSGAVYTLALKTHVGMSIQTFRYFAGWCDKIQVCGMVGGGGGGDDKIQDGDWIES